eukprot:TRINITY_DN40077_c0_g1_i1.p1 TRINITY_DN40077_c0_g1~~TRINITY_DN40077_c0_g1_i1.p1  ORF type:complete len:303 (-),score=40.75 TRINITY_DN40077_c0_g1_i1:432-1340(-)
MLMAHTAISASNCSLKFLTQTESPLKLSHACAFSSNSKLAFSPFPFRKSRLGCNAANRHSCFAGIRCQKLSSSSAPVGTNIWSIRKGLAVPHSPYCDTYAQHQQGPPVMLAERFQSVVTQLFQHRIIRCGGPVDDDLANLIVGQLLYLDAADPDRDIIMYINSPGGSVTAGMAIFDTMRHIRPDVSTVCVGLAASMGAFLLCSGTKGKRYSLPNARMMIHQPLGGGQGTQADLEIQANEILHHKATLSGYLAYQTGQPLEKIYEDTETDKFMSAFEAVKYGLIDSIITNPLKAFQPLPAPST